MANTTEPNAPQQAFAKLLEAYKAEQHYLTVEAATEELVDASADRMAEIERKMWRTPAPDLCAALVKMEISHFENEMPAPEAVASIIADLRRLSGQTVSPIFQADVWLAEWEQRGGCYLVRDGEALICGDPTNVQLRRLNRIMEQANGTQAVKAMVSQCCKGLEVEAAA